MNGIIINGQDYEWRQKSLLLAESRTSFTFVKFNYLEHYSFYRCYIERD